MPKQLPDISMSCAFCMLLGGRWHTDWHQDRALAQQEWNKHALDAHPDLQWVQDHQAELTA